mmetsp:Transcript_91291/g.136715  ORF Transcript_91291/g.136715 Transcript_91291/m.136715 type:complete len:110 (-) Transcript_91291:139-468(-)
MLCPFAQDRYIMEWIIHMLLLVVSLLCALVGRFYIVRLPAVFVYDDTGTVATVVVVVVVIRTLVSLVISTIVSPAVTSSPATSRPMTTPSWLAAAPGTLGRSGCLTIDS